MFKQLVLLLLVIVPLNSAVRRRCLNSGVLFPEKISSSPVVVFGESLGKRIYLDNDIEQLFNVTFRVDCLLKGQENIEERIEITQAGEKQREDQRSIDRSTRCFQESKLDTPPANGWNPGNCTLFSWRIGERVGMGIDRWIFKSVRSIR